MYTPTACEVLFAAEGITPAGKIAGVTSDQVRAALVRLTGKTIDGAAVTAALKAAYAEVAGAPGYFAVLS